MMREGTGNMHATRNNGGRGGGGMREGTRNDEEGTRNDREGTRNDEGVNQE